VVDLDILKVTESYELLFPTDFIHKIRRLQNGDSGGMVN
jgi:hypothetical protein